MDYSVNGSGERAVWLAVLKQGLEDTKYLSGLANARHATDNQKKEAAKMISQGDGDPMSWIYGSGNGEDGDEKGGDEDFKIVCSYAGVTPEAFRARFEEHVMSDGSHGVYQRFIDGLPKPGHRQRRRSCNAPETITAYFMERGNAPATRKEIADETRLAAPAVSYHAKKGLLVKVGGKYALASMPVAPDENGEEPGRGKVYNAPEKIAEYFMKRGNEPATRDEVAEAAGVHPTAVGYHLKKGLLVKIGGRYGKYALSAAALEASEPLADSGAEGRGDSPDAASLTA